MPDKKTIRVFNVTEEGRWGGPQKRILIVAKALKKLGVETTIVFPKKNSEMLWKLAEENGVDSIRLPISKITKKWLGAVRYLALFWVEVLLLVRVFRGNRPDVVHVNGSWQIKGLIAAKLCGIRSVWHLNDTTDRAWLKIMFRIFSGLADAVACSSIRTKENYGLSAESKPAGRLFEFRAPVDTGLFDAGKTEAARDIADRSGFKVLTIANVNPDKGIDVVVKTAKALGMREDAVFLIAGPSNTAQDKYMERVEQQMETDGVRNVVFLGHRNDIPELLKAADVYLCASRRESSPMAVWEAMSMGKRIVTTDVGDVNRESLRGCFESVVEVGDHEALAKALEKVMDDKGKSYSEKNRHCAVKYFDVERIARDHCKAYRALTANETG
jgi:glycosyltransferase involved in cell wall biosynthesis